MRTNFIRSSLLLMAAACVFVACDKEEESTENLVVQNGSSQTQSVFADDEQGSSGVSFTATAPWSSSISTASSAQTKADSDSPDWISISPDSGKEAGEYTIEISLVPNATGADRTAVITISCNGTDITITVTQKGVKEDGTIPEEPKQPSGGSGTFTYSLSDGFSFTFNADEAVYANGMLTLYKDGMNVGLEAAFFLPTESPLLSGTYEYAEYFSAGKNNFYSQKGSIDDYIWYTYPQGDNTIRVSIRDSLYTIRYSLYIAADGGLGELEGTIEGTYTGYVSTTKKTSL